MRPLVLVVAVLVGLATLATWWPWSWVNLDGDRMLAASRMFLDGGDIYSIPGYLYSPLAPILTAPLAIVPFGLAILFIVKLEIVVGYTGTRYGFALALVVLISPPITSDLILGNINLLLVAAAMWAIARNDVPSGAVFGVLFAAFPKPMLLPILLWLVLFRRRAAIGWIAGFTTSSAVGVLIAGPAAYSAFVGLLLRGGDVGARFVGNAGLTFIDPTAGVVVGLTAVAVFLWSLRACDPPTSLVFAATAGMLVGTYQPLYSAQLLLGILPVYAAAYPVRARIVFGAAFGAVVSLTAAAIITMGSGATPVSARSRDRVGPRIAARRVPAAIEVE
jgi:Glycosyltransferase family 87